MEYNTGRDHLTIPEYGRNVQKMIEFACEIADKEERNRVAKIIVGVMGQVDVQHKNLEEFEQKLWNHLFIISDFKLDVDSPYEKPTKEALAAKPERLSYSTNHIKYKHYGKSIQNMIKKCADMEDGEEKTSFKRALANIMKTAYLNWNRDSVNDEVISKHLTELSGGKLTLADDFEFTSTGEILAKTGGAPSNNNRNRRRNNNNNRNRNNNNGRNRKRN